MKKLLQADTIQYIMRSSLNYIRKLLAKEDQLFR